MKSLIGALLSVLLVPAVASAERHDGTIIRNINPSAREIGCTELFTECPGVTNVRTGLVVVDVSAAPLRTKAYQLIGWFQGAARPQGGLVRSQMMSGAGIRVPHGHSWVQAGAGFGAQQVGVGPSTIRTTHALQIARPAMMFGVGRDVAKFHGGPVLVALDGGTTIDDGDGNHVYQLTASLAGSL
ncbi:MAG TPA: hypothetical protein VGM88_11830 [Kofleriaceae bacterium]|jgi:hypothetical protein